MVSLTTVSLLVSLFTLEINGQLNFATFPSTVVVAGEDVKLECSFTLTGRTYSDAYLIESDLMGQQFATLVTTSSPVPGSRYSVEDLTSTQVVFGISNTVRSDDGYYLCYIETDGGPDVLSTPAKLTIQYIGGNLTTEVNSNTTAHNVIITCFGTVDGEPVPDIKLYKDNDIMQTEILPTTYKIDTVSQNDNGMYRCEASNIAGTVKSNTITLSYLSDIQFTLKDDIIAIPGDNINIEIDDISANPNDPVNIKWTIDTDVEYTADDTTFTLIAPEVDGTYTITMKATNIIGSAVDSINVTVSNSSSTTLKPEPLPSDKDENVLSTGAIVGIVVGAAILVIMVLIYLKFRPEKPSTSRMKVLPSTADVSTNGFLQVEFTPENEEKVQHCDWYKSDQNGVKGHFLVRSGDSNSRLTVAEDGSLKIPKVKQEDDGYYLCVMKTSEDVLKDHAKFTVTNGNKNEKSLKKNKSDGEPAIEMEEGKTPLGRYEAKGDKKKKQVEPEVDIDKKTKKPERPAQVDKQLRNVEELQYADLDLTRGLPKGASNEINHPDPEMKQNSTKCTYTVLSL